MNFYQSIVLGFIQGFTEFLPVSSSGHLILIRKFLNLPLENTLPFDVLLNTATLIAVIFCFYGDIYALIKDFATQGFSSRSKNLILALIVGTVPAAFVGYFFGEQIEVMFRSETIVAYALIAGSILMFIADRCDSRGGITIIKGFFVGIFQALALIPGISRSGSSISGGIISGLSREEAIKFSFLLLIPVSLGALVKVCLDFDFSNPSIIQFSIVELSAGFLAALLSGIWSVKFMLQYLRNKSFTPFIVYRIVIAIIMLSLV